MNKKIRVAFIYKSSNVFLTGKHFDNNYYHFFMDALKRNLELDVSYFPAEKTFDTSILKNNFDIILLWENHPWGTPDELIGIKSLNIPVICKVNDAHDAHAKGKIQNRLLLWLSAREFLPQILSKRIQVQNDHLWIRAIII